MCCSPCWLTTHDALDEDRCVPSPIALLSQRPACWYSGTNPDVRGLSHGPQTLHWAVSIQADHLFSSVSQLLLAPPGKMTKAGSAKVKKISESIQCESTLERTIVFLKIIKPFGQKSFFSFHRRGVHPSGRYTASSSPLLVMLTVVFWLRWFSTRLLRYQVAVFPFVINKCCKRKNSELFFHPLILVSTDDSRLNQVLV